MKLRSRIMVITFLLILFVQGLNCLLEIGFLANNLKQNNLRRFYVIGNEIRRKLNTSLIFGKSVSQLNFSKLLSNIIPQDIENLYVTDGTGHIVYSLRGGQKKKYPVSRQITQRRIIDSYHVILPLEKGKEFQGNVIMVASLHDTLKILLGLLQRSLVHFLFILGISLPLLYVVLTLFINRPYNRFVSDLGTWLTQGRVDLLHDTGIDLSPLDRAENELWSVRDAPFLAGQDLSGQLDLLGPDNGEQGERERIEAELSRIMGTGVTGGKS